MILILVLASTAGFSAAQTPCSLCDDGQSLVFVASIAETQKAEVVPTETTCSSLEASAAEGTLSSSACSYLRENMVMGCECQDDVATQEVVVSSACRPCTEPGYEILLTDGADDVCLSLNVAAGKEGISPQACLGLQETVAKMNCKCALPVDRAKDDTSTQISQSAQASESTCYLCNQPGLDIKLSEGDNRSPCYTLKVAAPRENVSGELCKSLQDYRRDLECTCGEADGIFSEFGNADAAQVDVAASDYPSMVPSDFPSSVPSDFPSSIPSDFPSSVPSDFPSSVPSDFPSSVPSDFPSSTPSDFPSSVPSDFPSDFPSTVDIPKRIDQLALTCVALLAECSVGDECCDSGAMCLGVCAFQVLDEDEIAVVADRPKLVPADEGRGGVRRRDARV
jgi:hypothetical protein